jgi:pheromone shutdown protein TraB
MKEKNEIKIGMIYGIYTLMGLMLYFGIMKYFGLAEILELRALNFLILFSGIFSALKRLTPGTKMAGVDYFTGMKTGFLTTFVAVTLFAFLLGIYLNIDDTFMNHVKKSSPFGLTLTPITASVIVYIEGLISGFLITYILMQWFRREP